MFAVDIELLKLFVNVVELGTVSEAASRVYLSQPAATRALQRLESRLDVSLFDRVGRVLVPNAAGRALYPRAKTLLNDVSDLERDVKHAQERDYHDVSIGSVDSIGTYIMPSVLASLASSFDGLGLKFHTARTIDLLRRLDDDLDVAVVAYSGPPTEDAIRVAAYDLQFYGRRERFADLADVTSESELGRFPVIQIQASAGQPTLIDRDAHSFAVAQSLACVKSLIMGGVGVGALLDYMLNDGERKDLVCGQIPHDPDCALWVCRSKFFVGSVADTIVDSVTASMGSAVA